MAAGRIDLDLIERACANLGDVVVDPSLWPKFMDQICQAAGASGAMLVQTDVRTPDIPRTASIDEGIRYYFENNWHTRDMRGVRGVPLLLRGDPVIVDQDFITPDEIRRDAFYNECLFPLRMPWFAGVGFSTGEALWAMALQRSSQLGPFEAPDKRVLATLSRRLTETATLSTAVGRVALVSATGALAAVRQPAIAIDRLGRVLDCNAAADAIFDDDIHVKNQRLVLRDKDAKRRFDDFTTQLMTTRETAALDAAPITAAREGRRPVIIRALPVPPAARNPFLGARVLLTLTSLEPEPFGSAVTLMRIFALTPAEAKLAALMVEGISPEQIAERLAISRETVRNQLKAVFAKTQTSRQAELVALLARI